MRVSVIVLNKSDMQIKQGKKYTASNAMSWRLRSLLLMSNAERFKKIRMYWISASHFNEVS